MRTTEQEKLAELMQEVEAKLKEAQQYADQHGIPIYWDGPNYGMGGTYIPNSTENSWEESDAGTWVASSQSC